MLSRLQHMGYFIVVRHVECVFNANYFAKANCDVISPRNRSVNAELQLIQKIRHIMGTLKVSIPNAKKKMQKIFDMTFELCKVLKERKKKTLIELLNAMSGKPGDTRVFCPFNEVSYDIMILDLSTLTVSFPQGTYRANNITIVESLPPVLTESEFLINFNWFQPRVANVFNLTVLGHLYDVAKERARKKKYLR